MMADLGGRQQMGEKSGVEGYCTELEIHCQEKEIEPMTYVKANNKYSAQSR